MPQSEAATSARRAGSTRGCSPSPTFETLIAAALCAERQAVIPVIGEAVNELLDVEREHHKSELASTTRGLELQLAKLESAVSALQPALERDNRKAILDLPNSLTPVN